MTGRPARLLHRVDIFQIIDATEDWQSFDGEVDAKTARVRQM